MDDLCVMFVPTFYCSRVLDGMMGGCSCGNLFAGRILSIHAIHDGMMVIQIAKADVWASCSLYFIWPVDSMSQKKTAEENDTQTFSST